MQPLLFLAHRIPYPPNKGDKIRSFHLLRFLARRYAVHLGTFVDDAADWAHEAALGQWCASRHVAGLHRGLARVRSLSGLLRGEPLTLPYYRDPSMQRWVKQTVERHRIERAIVFSSAMAQYVEPLPALPVVTDFVDVDSAKWSAYAQRRDWPASLIYRREGTRLLAAERRIAARSAACVFVTAAEVELFTAAAPEARAKTVAIGNGVDTEYFAPAADRASPYPPGTVAIAFTGAMDYWPNIDAVSFFAREVLPRVRARRPDARFFVVGMNPAPAVQALRQEPGVTITGRVDDVRPYLQHARVVVAPLRIARGVQNKALEAMSMARPVVVHEAAARGIRAVRGVEIEAAAGADEFAACVLRLLDPQAADALGCAARARVESDYGWDANLRRFADLVEGALQPRRAEGASR
jgi:sugar transferase (PEP-CTERM/EpsH1 system associated)